MPESLSVCCVPTMSRGADSALPSRPVMQGPLRLFLALRPERFKNRCSDGRQQRSEFGQQYQLVAIYARVDAQSA
jgi:hypothetical protein